MTSTIQPQTHKLNKLRGGLVVSIQPVENSPMDNVAIIVAMAEAAVAGGAAGLRIEGIENCSAVRRAVNVPLIGIVKRDLKTSPVRITALLEDANALVNAGVDIIATDMTDRIRPEPIEYITNTVLDAGKLLMADCATEQDANSAIRHGAHIIGTTLSGYTAATHSEHEEPDFELITKFRVLAGDQSFVMAEGRFNAPALAAQAIASGADCVTVGSAITRLEHVVGWFDHAIKNAD